MELVGEQFPEATLEMIRRFKALFDPACRLNPGKMLPTGKGCVDYSADQHWGDALSLYQGEAAFQCYTHLPDDPTSGQILNYGQTLANGSITCKSEQAGITCTDATTGHFFRIARESYQLG